MGDPDRGGALGAAVVFVIAIMRGASFKVIMICIF